MQAVLYPKKIADASGGLLPNLERRKVVLEYSTECNARSLDELCDEAVSVFLLLSQNRECCSENESTIRPYGASLVER